MGYEFRPPGASSIDLKKIGIGLVAVLFIFVLYSVGTVVTGYTSYSGKLEDELNSTKEDLRIISAAREECAQSLIDKSAAYSECSGKLQSSEQAADKCETDLSSLRASSESSLNECRTELNSLKTNQSSLSAGYKNLVKNSVKAICCTLSDVESASAKQWRIDSDKIFCSGNFTVNCATGETSGF
ncbi:MAG: hypothetical protein HY368_01390 [Candidatus Aenigmarchaeota archaeon]|nr:hypothetical protein [Candidatus Aenigmarchaeota archaeon]